jgi:hypothetical protein
MTARDRSSPAGRSSVTDNAAIAHFAVIVGAPGSGKSSGICCALEANPPARLMIFDPGEDYTRFGVVFRDVRALVGHVLKAGQGPCRAVFAPSLDQDRERKQFDLFCQIAFCAANITVIADELEDVVLPNWAPAGWRLLVRKGRKRGVRLIASSQRPAGLEKRIWSFAPIVRTGVLDDDEDAREVAKRVRVTPADVLALPSMHYIQWMRETRTIRRGHIEWRAGRPHDVTDSENIFSPPGAP